MKGEEFQLVFGGVALCLKNKKYASMRFTFTCICTRTHKHTHTHTHVHTHTHTHAHTHAHTCTHTYQHAVTHTPKLSLTRFHHREERIHALWRGFVPKSLRLGIGQTIGLLSFQNLLAFAERDCTTAGIQMARVHALTHTHTHIYTHIHTHTHTQERDCTTTGTDG
jgi:hypothetical protein